MIVLDEHLQGLGLEQNIRRWYRGRVCLITDLRPGTVIKDDAIPVLLRAVAQPTFITLNWPHFWQRVEASEGFCLVCFTLPTGQAAEVAVLLRRLFRLPGFQTRSARAGRVARVSGEQVAYYTVGEREVSAVSLPQQ